MKWDFIKKFATVMLSGSLVGGSIALFFTSSQGNDVSVSGSTTVLPLMEALSAGYFGDTGARVNVSGGGSTAGINQIKAGVIQLGDSSRAPSPEDVTEDWDNLATIPLGQDVISILVNFSAAQIPDRDYFRENASISLSDLEEIYRGRLTNWSQINSIKETGSNPDGETISLDERIQVIGRQTGSGLRDSFYSVLTINDPDYDDSGTPEAEANNLRLENEIKFDIPSNAALLNSNGLIESSTQAIENSISYISLAYISQEPYRDDPTASNLINGRNVYALRVSPPNSEEIGVRASLINAARSILPGIIEPEVAPSFLNSFTTNNIGGSDNPATVTYPSLEPSSSFTQNNVNASQYPFWHTLYTIYNTRGTRETQTISFLEWIFTPQISGIGSIPTPLAGQSASFEKEFINGIMDNLPRILSVGYVPPLFGLQQNFFNETDGENSPQVGQYFLPIQEGDNSSNSNAILTNDLLTYDSANLTALDTVQSGWDAYLDFTLQPDAAKGFLSNVGATEFSTSLQRTGAIPEWASNIPISPLNVPETTVQNLFNSSTRFNEMILQSLNQREEIIFFETIKK